MTLLTYYVRYVLICKHVRVTRGLGGTSLPGRHVLAWEAFLIAWKEFCVLCSIYVLTYLCVFDMLDLSIHATVLSLCFFPYDVKSSGKNKGKTSI